MPAVLLTLLAAHTRAFLRRIQSSLSTARLMSTVVLVLVLAWSGQTIASIMFREAYEPAVFRTWVAALVFAWTLWHCVHVAWKRPDTPIEWTAEEEYLIVASPFSAQQRLMYRVAMVLTATLPKALLTMLVLSPDLSWGSPTGVLLALLGLEAFRMLLDIGISTLSARSYLVYRTFVAAALTTLVVLGYAQIAHLSDHITATGGTASAWTATELLQSVIRHPVITAVAVPFFRIADGITASGPLLTVATQQAGMAAGILIMLWLMIRLESRGRQLSIQRERAAWSRAPRSVADAGVAGNAETAADRTQVTGNGCLPRIPCDEPLIWRQCRRVLRYYGSVLVALGVPVILLSPLMRLGDPTLAFIMVVCGALFYTFVLLPEAIKFDFRFDCDHMDQLKLLPMTPTQIVLAQLTTPVALCCLFQAAVFIGVGVLRSIEPLYVVAAVALCIPLTILFVALDNLAFLVSPHRPTQEGFEAFLRTILKFTAKSLLMVGFLLLLAVWAPVAAAIAQITSSPTTIVFGVGVVLGIAGLAAASVGCVITAFRRFDVSAHAVT